MSTDFPLLGNDPYSVESVSRALEIVEALQEGGEMGVSEIARRCGMYPSTVHRLLSTLRARGFVEQDPDSRYRLGPRLISRLAISNLCVGPSE